MRPTPFLITISVLLLSLTIQSAWGQSANMVQSASGQVLVLKNGEVLVGVVSETATNTTVQTKQGSRLVLNPNQVDFVCDTIRDAYWGRAARTKANDIAGQKSIFFWCLKHGLHEEAQNQLLLLSESKQVTAMEIEYLDRQLNVSLTQFQNGQQDPQPESAKPKLVATNDVDHNAFTPLPPMQRQLAITNPVARLPKPGIVAAEPMMSLTDQGTIKQVGYEEEIGEEIHRTIAPGLGQTNDESVRSQPEIVSNAELDRMTRSMPEGTLGPYRSGLERVLINGCSAAKCHDSKSEIMPLQELGFSKPIPRRMSQRNLYQTLKQIDRSQPFDSALLAAASKPHGGIDEPVLPVGTKHFEQLKLWVVMLSDDPEGNFQAYLNPDLQTNSLPEPIVEPSAQEKIVPIEPERIGLQPSVPAIPHSQTIGEIPELKPEAQTYQPVDPFDPEVFNRQHGDR